MPTLSNVVVTGSSTGFGHDSVLELLAAGHRVVGTMRDLTGRNSDAAARLRSHGATVVELDVTDQASVDRAAGEILAKLDGVVDVLINNAGTAHMGTTEAFTAASLERQFATNVTGPFRMSRAFLPGMRERRRGLVVFVGSVVGRFVVPFTGVYSASKYAIEGLAESLSYELRPFDVDVTIVEPGAYATNIFNVMIAPDDGERLTSYGEVAKTIEVLGSAMAASAGDPKEVARAIASLVAQPAGARPLRLVVPSDHPVTAINANVEPIQRSLLTEFGLGHLLPKEPAAH